MFNAPTGGVPGTYVSAPVRSGASIVAILCALGSFWFSSRGTESLGFILAFVAIGAGLIGGIKALSPRVNGGILSIIAVLMGLIGLIFAFIAVLS
jgi:hypothetical protein